MRKTDGTWHRHIPVGVKDAKLSRLCQGIPHGLAGMVENALKHQDSAVPFGA